MRMALLSLVLLASACTTTGTTSSTTPPAATAVIDGVWTAQLDLQDRGPGHSVRTFTYATTCTGSDCTTVGTIETSDETHTIPVDFDGTAYHFGFGRSAMYQQDGIIVCRWTSTMRYELHVSSAKYVGETWQAMTLDGTLVEEPTVVFEQDGTDCSMPVFVSSIHAAPQN